MTAEGEDCKYLYLLHPPIVILSQKATLRNSKQGQIVRKDGLTQDGNSKYTRQLRVEVFKIGIGGVLPTPIFNINTQTVRAETDGGKNPSASSVTAAARRLR